MYIDPRVKILCESCLSLNPDSASYMLGNFGEVNYLLCASVSSPVKWRNNSVSLSGQGSFWGMQPVTSHMVWHSVQPCVGV